MQRFLEGLTAEHDGNFFHNVARIENRPLIADARGSPENVGTNLRAVQCVRPPCTSCPRR